MLFKRREKQAAFDVVRTWIWPRRGWRRSWNYLWRRIARLPGSPHAIAIGFALGVFSAFTPFVGLHFFLAALLALLVRGNVLASALGTFVGNPLTFPIIWVATYELGNFVLGLEGRHDVDLAGPAAGLWYVLTSPSVMWTDVWSSLLPLIGPMMVGALLLGGVISVFFYIGARIIVGAYQRSRRDRIVRTAAGRTDRRPHIEA
jgi:hypothetical protein